MKVQTEAPDLDTSIAQRRAGATQEEFVQFTSVRAVAGSASSQFSFGSHALRPSTGLSGDEYYETDRHWVYYYSGTAWKFLSGINYGTNATRAAISVTANDDGAVFYATDTKLWWQVSSGAWAQRDVAALITVRKNTGADVGTRPRINFIEGAGVTLTIADDAGSNEIDLTIAASGTGAPSTSTFITQTPDAGLSNEQALSLLATGLMKVTTATGVVSSVVPAAGIETFLTTPTSANLAAALTDETGTGANVFATSPTLVTPALGTPSSGTLTSCTGLPISTGVSGLGANVATFLGTPSSANMAAAVTGETGSGALVFATSPTLSGPTVDTSLAIQTTTTYGTTGDGAATLMRGNRFTGAAVDSLTWQSYRSDGASHATRMTLTAGGGGGVGVAILRLNDTDLHIVNGNVGIGTNTFGASAASVLALLNGTAPTTSPADTVQLFSTDLSAGNATLGIRTETAVVTESVVSDRTLSVKINGTTYKICLKS